MVKSNTQNNSIKHKNQGKTKKPWKPAKINANTHYDVCDSRLTPYGGLLPLIKFLDLVNFEEIFNIHYTSPLRKSKLGCSKMVKGFLMLLFIGFTRINHFSYIREDQMICGIMGVSVLPAVSTFWRYLNSLCLNQSRQLLKISAHLRSRAWQMCEIGYTTICIDIDTTVSTVYGNIEGSRKGHNTKHRGKKGLRPGFLFIAETREYLCGTQRMGKTMSDKETAKLIRQTKMLLPSCVKTVIVRGDGEFIGFETVKACKECGYHFIIANKSCSPVFDEDYWYSNGSYTYNETFHKPHGWDKACRFVVMRIPKEEKGYRQLSLFKDHEYAHRVFVTDLTWKPHIVIKKYDIRANVENSIKEAQHEGILAIPSRRFLSNHVYFQIVMLAFNIWRWMKLSATHSQKGYNDKHLDQKQTTQLQIEDHTIRVARLKMLFISAKIATHENKIKVRYSAHDSRCEGAIDFMEYLDKKRKQEIDWKDDVVVINYKKTG